MRRKVGFVIVILTIIAGLVLLTTGYLGRHENLEVTPEGLFISYHFDADVFTIPLLHWQIAFTRAPFKANWFRVAVLAFCMLVGVLLMLFPRRRTDT